MNSLGRITVNPERCGGRLCILGMRFQVIDVLGSLDAGVSFKKMLSEMPNLEREDIRARVPHKSNCLEICLN